MSQGQQKQKDADYRMLMRFLKPFLGLTGSLFLLLVGVMYFPQYGEIGFAEAKQAYASYQARNDDPYGWENTVTETALVWKNLQVYPVQEREIKLSAMWGLFTDPPVEGSEMCVAFEGAIMTFLETVPGEMTTQFKVRYSQRQTDYEWECQEGDEFLVLPAEYGVRDVHLMGEY